MRKRDMETLTYKQFGIDDQLRRRLNFWQLWALIATGLFLFLALLMATTGPVFWLAAFREFFHQLFGAL